MDFSFNQFLLVASMLVVRHKTEDANTVAIANGVLAIMIAQPFLSDRTSPNAGTLLRSAVL